MSYNNKIDIATTRLTTQHIAQADFSKPEDAVQHMLAMQAQDYNGALWAVGLRTKSCTKQDIEHAIADKKIVRTWPMRGTLHFMHADDARWMVNLLAPRITASVRGRRIKQLGLTDAVVAEAENVLTGELKGGKSILRPDITALLAGKVKGLRITNQHSQHLMRNFGERAIICFGPPQGKQPTFVLFDEWLPGATDKPRDEALKELAVRYFSSHGPAQLSDLAGWAGLTISDARQALAKARPELDELVVSDTIYYTAPTLQPAGSPSAYLLPGFDEYMLGYKDRSAALAKEHSNKIVPGGNGMFLPTIIVNGQVVGTWKRQVKAKEVVITLEPFTRLSQPTNTAITEAVIRYGRFIGLTGRLG